MQFTNRGERTRDPVCTCGHGLTLHVEGGAESWLTVRGCVVCAEILMAGGEPPLRACHAFEEP